MSPIEKAFAEAVSSASRHLDISAEKRLFNTALEDFDNPRTLLLIENTTFEELNYGAPPSSRASLPLISETSSMRH